MKKIAPALRKTLSDRRGILSFVVASLVIFVLFVMVPVWTTPGNDVAFQLSITKPATFALMAFLSLLNGLVIAMQFHVHWKKKAKSHVAAGSFLGSVVASLLATIGCAACYSSVLALFGLGGTVFIVEHRYWIASLAAVLSLISIAKTSRNIEDGCEVCKF